MGIRDPIVWALPCGTPTQQAEDIRQAFQYWESAAYARPLFAETACLVADERYASSFRGLAVYIGGAPPRPDWVGSFAFMPGHAPTAWGWIVLFDEWSNRLSRPLRQSVVRHEIGHAFLGQGHATERQCLMTEKLSNWPAGSMGLCAAELMALRMAHPDIF
jgi:hypothetical protein